ncbi:MAG: cation diffusion facilitator family transporter [Pseudomonadota bacterium]
MHDPTHARDHSHGHHEVPQETRRLALAIGITLSVAVVQATGGWFAGSVVLLADSAHMLTDALALALAWFAVRWSRRPADAEYSYGGARFSALAAFVNGLGIIGIGFGLAWESIEHVRSPVPVDARLMLGVALVGGASNLIVLRMLGSGAHAHGSLNMRAAALHVASDLLGSVAAVVAAVAILLTGWVLADPIASLLVTILIVRSGVLILRESARVLLEAVPKNFDSAAVERDLLANVPEISGVHHLHAWTLSGTTPIVSLHAVARAGVNLDETRVRIQERLREHFSIAHATVQIEWAPCADACSAAEKH